MAYENTGRLFRNTDKKTAKSPDYTGDFTDNTGTKMNVAAWIKPGTEGRPDWLSFRISEHKPATESSENSREEKTGLSDDEKLPF